ncbi:MAG: hypothetical protein WC542_02950 [Paludibacter sp.]
MKYLIWGLLNIGLIIYFLTICIKVTKLVREKMGLIVTVFFVLTLLSFIGNANKDSFSKTNSNQTKTWNNTSEDNLTFSMPYLPRIEMENNLVTSYYLEIFYGKDKNDSIVPKSAYTSNAGLIAGTKWTPISIEINETSDKKKYSYSVLGVVEWNLLGTTIYTQQKRFTGTFLTEKT